MGGGWPMYPKTNSFTLHTPYEMMKIQQNLESKVVFDPTSSTGMRKWNEDCECMKEWKSEPKWTWDITASPTQSGSVETMMTLLSKYSNIRINFYNGGWTKNIYIPTASTSYVGKVIFIDHNAGWSSTVNLGSKTMTVRKGEELIFVGKEDKWEQVDNFPPVKMTADQNIPRTPAKQGVPVTTLVGYYDPEEKLESFIYNELHGAYGNTFPEDSEDEIRNSKCYATITNSSEKTLKYALKGNRKAIGNMNKFHINVAESFEPKHVSIQCNGRILTERPINGPTNKDLFFTVNGRPL